MRRLRRPGSLAACLLALRALAPAPSGAQEVIRLDPASACAAQPGPLPDEVYLFRATAAAEEAIQGLVDYLGLSASQLRLKAANISNAIAYLDPLTQERLILYDENFVRGLQERSESVWVRRAILAHELAHHLEGHLQSTNPERRKVEELEADRFAGHMLFKLDADLDAVEAVFQQLAEGEGYPPRTARVAAAINGWSIAKEQSEYEPGREAVADAESISLPENLDPERPWESEGEAPWQGEAEPPSTASQRNDVRLTVQQAPFVIHAGGLAGGSGLAFDVAGRIEVPTAGHLGAVVLFAFPDGRVLFPHPQELHYRAADNRLATGSPGQWVEAGTFDLSRLAIAPIPHYSLNLVPTGYQSTYPILAFAWIYLDGVAIAASETVELSVVW